MAAMEELIRWMQEGGAQERQVSAEDLQLHRADAGAAGVGPADPAAYEQRLDQVLLSCGFPAGHPILVDWARVKFALRELERHKAVVRERRPGECQCAACVPLSLENMRMVVCEHCGSKRCPHATDHRLACTNSNDSGQAGSSYGRLLVAGPEVACAEDLELVARRLESFAWNGPTVDAAVLRQAARLCRQVASSEPYDGGPVLPDPHPISEVVEAVRSLLRDHSSRAGSVSLADVEAALGHIERQAMARFSGWLGQRLAMHGPLRTEKVSADQYQKEAAKP